MPDAPAPPLRLRTPPWVWAALAAAAVVLVAYSLYGIAAPLYWGHHSYNIAIYLMRARTSLRWHTIVPYTWTGFDPPRADSLYLHHPIGYHQIFTLLLPLVGDHEWLGRAVGLTGTLAVVALVFATVRRFWSPAAAVLAVWLFVTLPIVTSYSAFCDAMMPELFCILLAVGIWARLLEREPGRVPRRLLVGAFCAYAVGGLLMWEVFFVAPLVVLHALVRRRRYLALRVGRWPALAVHAAVVVLACALVLGFHLALIHHTGAARDIAESYAVRHATSRAIAWFRPLHWIDLMYGWPPFFFALTWLVLFAPRAWRGQARARDLLPLVFLWVNCVYNVAFGESAAVHVYRVFMFSGFVVLATTDLFVGAAREATTRNARLAVAAVLVGYFALELPHAAHNLVESRVMAGTQGEPEYDPQRDKTRFFQEVHRRVPADARVIIDYRQLSARKELWYYLDRSFDEVSAIVDADRLPGRDRSVLLVDESKLDAGERTRFRALLRVHPVVFFERFAMVDLRSDRPGETSYGFVDGATSAAYRFWVSPWPQREIVRKAWLPGLCDALAAGAPLARDEAPPDSPPLDGDWVCYHNVLQARGDDAAPAERQLQATLMPLARALGSATLLGIERRGGTARLVWRAAGPERGELHYLVDGALLPRGLDVPRPATWRAGFLYEDRVPLTSPTSAITVELAAPTGNGARPPARLDSVEIAP